MWFNQWYQWIFYQEKSTWSTFTGYFSCFFQIKFTFWHEIQKIDFNFVFWQVKSDKFICICVLTETIQQIDLNFCFDMKIQTSLFEFVFWQRKSIWSICTGYLLHFLKSNSLFDRKNQINSFASVFWQKQSSKLIWIFALT